MNGAITLVKSDYATAAAAAEDSSEIDLGLAINEAARIMGLAVDLRCEAVLVAATAGLGQLAISFDPEDTATVNRDDEQFCYLVCSFTTIAGATGACKTSESRYMDFSRMNLITTRNMRIIVAAVGYTFTGQVRVYYEKYAPEQFELVQLIASRR